MFLKCELSETNQHEHKNEIGKVLMLALEDIEWGYEEPNVGYRNNGQNRTGKREVCQRTGMTGNMDLESARDLHQWGC